MGKVIEIADQQVGAGYPCFIIAEAGVNHNGNLKTAKRLVDAAVSAGANAVKFQTFVAEQVISPIAPQADYQLKNTGKDESQLEMVQRLELSVDDHHQLQSYCQQKNILFLSTPFDQKSVDLLDQLNVPAYKIGSGEITNWPLLEYIAQKGKPIILSTGMSNLSEVEEAVGVLQNTGNNQIILMHCVSNYPADPADVNLRAMLTMEKTFQVPVGYSDHTLGIEVPLAAVALGACVIEKHFTLDRTMPGPDHRASLEPEFLKAMVSGIRIVEQSLGHGRKEPAASELDTARAARRSLVAAQDISKGTVIEERHIDIKRPGTGLSPQMIDKIIGQKAIENIKEGSLIKLEMLS
ncbi:MAG: N-acetylneuraminate synthase [Anaerolineales bacterium]